ncbi:MAG TPA: hypothetical protein VLC93_11610, partial [Myxococcota bacterium]|nr:hypothetical protein [Myxococcota bacterium]
MTLVTNLILRTIWAETRGTDDARAKQLVDIAKTRGVPANDLALGRVVDLVQRRQFSRVAAMFADAPSSTRPHDVATQGMRAGGFASV